MNPEAVITWIASITLIALLGTLCVYVWKAAIERAESARFWEQAIKYLNDRDILRLQALIAVSLTWENKRVAKQAAQADIMLTKALKELGSDWLEAALPYDVPIDHEIHWSADSATSVN